MCLLLILSNKLDLNQETRFTIGKLDRFTIISKLFKFKINFGQGGGGAVVEHWIHNPMMKGSNPAAGTREK